MPIIQLCATGTKRRPTLVGFLGTSLFLVGMSMVLSCAEFAFFRKPLSKLFGFPGSLVLWLQPFLL
jgi:hypothetical protein